MPFNISRFLLCKDKLHYKLFFTDKYFTIFKDICEKPIFGQVHSVVLTILVIHLYLLYYIISECVIYSAWIGCPC